MKITLDSLQKATRQLATENSKTEGLSGLEYLFADDIDKDDEINLNPEPAKDDETEAKDENEDATPVADALNDLKEVALDAADDETLGDEAPDLDDEDTMLDLSSGKKDDKDKEDEKEKEKPEDDSEKDDKEKDDDEKKDDKEDEDKEPADESCDSTQVTEGDRIKIPCTCPMCKQTQEIEVDADAYDAWQGGELIQNAFPDLSPDEREALKTGICGKCWDKMFGGPEDFEDEDEYKEVSECKGFDKGENGKAIVEGGRKHCKTVKVHVYDIDWDTSDEKHWDDDQPLDVDDDGDEHWDDDQIDDSEPMQDDMNARAKELGLPSETDLEVMVCPGDDLDEVIGDALSDEYEYCVKGFNFDVVEDDGEVDESALGDAFKSIGQGIKDLLKTTLKGAAVLIAGLGGSFLFGLPGLLLAVCIAFGLMSAKESAKGVEVDEGLLGGVKDKLKTVIGVLKADPKKSKEFNDKMLAAKKAGDKEAMKKIAGEVKALAGNGGKTPPDEGKKDEVEIAEGDGCCECEVAEDAAEEGKEKHTYTAYFDTSVPADPPAEGYSITTDRGDEYAVSVISQVADNEAVYFPLENVTKDDEDWYDEYNEILNQLMGEDRVFDYDYSSDDIDWIGMKDDGEEEDDEEVEVDERHGEFKRHKFKRDKWGDGRRGRPNRREEDEIDPLDLDLVDDEDASTNDIDIVDDEDDDYSEVAEDGDEFKDGPAKALKSIGIEDPEKASEEDLEAAKALLGIEVTEDGDECKDGKCKCGADGCKDCGTKDVSTVAEMRTFLRECSTFKKNPRLRKAVSKFTRMMAESPRMAQALVDQLDHRFKGRPVTERRFCETFVKSI